MASIDVSIGPNSNTLDAAKLGSDKPAVSRIEEPAKQATAERLGKAEQSPIESVQAQTPDISKAGEIDISA